MSEGTVVQGKFCPSDSWQSRLLSKDTFVSLKLTINLQHNSETHKDQLNDQQLQCIDIRFN